MPATPRDSQSSDKGSGLWARLRGAYAPRANVDEATKDDVQLQWDDASTPSDGAPVAVAAPATDDEPALPEVPVATPVVGIEEPVNDEATDVEENEVEVDTTPPQQCQFCHALRKGKDQYCPDCGLQFPEPVPVATVPKPASASGQRLANRYAVVRTLSTGQGLTRLLAKDHGAPDNPDVIVVQVKYERPPDASLGGFETEVAADPLVEAEKAPAAKSASLPEDLGSSWPGLGWEASVLEKAQSSGLPRVLDHFAEEDSYYLVLSAATGQTLWDAWEADHLTNVQRFEWLAQLAEAFQALANAGAVLENLRPEQVLVGADGHVHLNELADLLPLPFTGDLPLRATLYTPPEMVYSSDRVGARAALYSFGAILYSLYVGRELSEVDFDREGVPKSFILQYPDAHPAVARILMKTFVRDLDRRFPTEETAKDDPTGLTELASVLRNTGRAMTAARLDVASWTTTGMVRTGNEDAFALLHAAGSKVDEMGERLLVILADGMGGYEAGEVAASMAIESLRKKALKEPLFAAVTGDAAAVPIEFNESSCLNFFMDALRDANKEIHQASRVPGQKRRGMGCTCEVVYLDGVRLLVGHVGDSRTYRYSRGRLMQVTRDQTLVNRLVELGQLSPEEAEDHPRKNELQQALGGQPYLDPATYSERVQPGDWVLVCSDGVTNHVDNPTLVEMIQRADSADMLARRLVNLANAQGGTDNATVVAIRIV